MNSWMTIEMPIEIANASEKPQSCARSDASGKCLGSRCTMSAPAVNPKSATEIATNAKWYHIVTLKIRVSTISYINVDNVTRKSPA